MPQEAQHRCSQRQGRVPRRDVDSPLAVNGRVGINQRCHDHKSRANSLLAARFKLAGDLARFPGKQRWSNL
jgi:hypothetical protein